MYTWFDILGFNQLESKILFLIHSWVSANAEGRLCIVLEHSIGHLSICGLWYPWGSWNHSLVDTEYSLVMSTLGCSGKSVCFKVELS